MDEETVDVILDCIRNYRSRAAANRNIASGMSRIVRVDAEARERHRIMAIEEDRAAILLEQHLHGFFSEYSLIEVDHWLYGKRLTRKPSKLESWRRWIFGEKR